MDSTTYKLFGKFPREIATPKRRLAFNRKDFEKFIETNSGITDCYTSVYPLNLEIDKQFYDFDGVFNGIEDSLPFAQKFYRYLYEYDYSPIPVASGKKGFHIYNRLEPSFYDNPKELLTNAGYYLLRAVFGRVWTESVTVRGKVTPVLRNEEGLIFCDPRIIGDVRRITRIPNTLRPPENRNWCTYLSPDKFLDMNVEDVARHCKSTHVYDYKEKKLPLLTDFEISEREKIVIPKEYSHIKDENNIDKLDIRPENPLPILKGVLRPALYRGLTKSEPAHDVRIACAIDLLEIFTPSTVLHIYSKLKWKDFSYGLSDYYIRDIIDKHYKNYGNKRLEELGIVG